MIVFYTDQIDDQKAFLTGDEAGHCSRVLRKRAGDRVIFIDGKGSFYESEIITVKKTECELSIIRKWEQESKNHALTIAISPVKNPSRFEWFVEKAVETGIDTIIPLICDRTEKMHIKESRLKGIIVAASKQTLKAKFTSLHDPVSFRELIGSIETEQAFIPHLNDKTEYLGKIIKPRSSYTVFIGPEGDFTDEEVEIAIQNGIIPASLGANRLRTETAGIIAGQIIGTINEINQ